MGVGPTSAKAPSPTVNMPPVPTPPRPASDNAVPTVVLPQADIAFAHLERQGAMPCIAQPQALLGGAVPGALPAWSMAGMDMQAWSAMSAYGGLRLNGQHFE